MIIKTEAYLSTDGEIHKTEIEAVEHDMRRKISEKWEKERWGKHSLCVGIPIYLIDEWIVKNRNWIIKVLTNQG